MAFLAMAACSLARAWDVQMTLHLVEMEHRRMSEMLAEGLPEDEMFLRARAMVAARNARAVDTAVVRGKAGERVVLEFIREISYPTSRQPPSLPPSKEEQERRRRIVEGWRKVERFFPLWPGGWEGSFETRNVGLTLEVETPDGDAEAGSFGFELSKHGRDFPLRKITDLNGRKVESRYPVFDRVGASVSLPPVDGRWRMLAVLTPLAADGSLDTGRKILAFVKMDVLK